MQFVLKLISKIKSDNIFVFGYQITSKIKNLCYLILLNKYISTEAFGIYSQFINSIAIITMLSDLGLGFSLTRFLPSLIL